MSSLQLQFVLLIALAPVAWCVECKAASAHAATEDGSAEVCDSEKSLLQNKFHHSLTLVEEEGTEEEGTEDSGAKGKEDTEDEDDEPADPHEDDEASLSEVFKVNSSKMRASMTESGGFFDEPDEAWHARKQRHVNQMNTQHLLMTTCPEEFWKDAKPCLVGCAGVKAGENLTECPAYTFWQLHYEPSFACVFEERIGMAGEGGKWICDPKKIRTKKDCLVYSIGSHGQYDFEEAVHNDISSECEIHTVDMKPWKNYTNQAPPDYVTYHVSTIGPAPENTPVDKLVKDLGHAGREIDIFKIDCEGCEWQTYKSWFGVGVSIRQIQVELHGTNHGRAHEFFQFLFSMGYVVFHKEPNTLGCQGNCIEYAFVRLTPQFSLANDTKL